MNKGTESFSVILIAFLLEQNVNPFILEGYFIFHLFLKMVTRDCRVLAAADL